MAHAQEQSAHATVKQRQAQQAQPRMDLERTQIRSPVDGIVIKRSVEAGQTVASSLQAPELFVIARNPSGMQVDASIDESEMSRVRVGQVVSFTVDTFPGRNFEGRVQQLRKAALNSQNVVTYVAVARFTNADGQLLPGMTANVRIVIDTRDDVLKVPNAALRVRIAGVEPAAPAAARREGGPGGPVGGPGGGLLREFRERLVRDLQLLPGQLEEVDAVMQEARPRFMELRNLSEDKRSKARERNLGDLRAQVTGLMQPAQKAAYQQKLADLSSRQSTRERIHLLGGDGRPQAFDVRLGVTDGTATELLVPGAVVITGVLGAAPAAAGNRQAPASPRMKF